MVRIAFFIRIFEKLAILPATSAKIHTCELVDTCLILSELPIVCANPSGLREDDHNMMSLTTKRTSTELVGIVCNTADAVADTDAGSGPICQPLLLHQQYCKGFASVQDAPIC